MLTYLASPYTHADPAVREARYHAACKKAAELMLAGKVIFCPIAHSHPIAEQRGWTKNPLRERDTPDWACPLIRKTRHLVSSFAYAYRH